MSRIVRNYNGWGSGDLNGVPSANKTNGEQLKRYGPLGIAGIGGVVRKNGSEHEIVYELSGAEVLTENGINAVDVIRVELPDAVGRFDSAIIKVQEAFEAGAIFDVNVASQPSPGSGFTVKSVLDVGGAPLDTVGVYDVALTLVAGDLNVFEDGGSVIADFTRTIAGAGKAELILKYTSL